MKKLKTEELNRLSVEGFKNADKYPVVFVLDNIRSLNNIGSIFRTADAFRIRKIYLCGITATPPHREIHKTALGATESVDWEYVENITDVVSNLIRSKYLVYALEQTDKSESLQNLSFDRNCQYAFILGNEINGVSEKVFSIIDSSIEIPQFGTKHSFNVSISAGILLWQYYLSVQK